MQHVKFFSWLVHHGGDSSRACKQRIVIIGERRPLKERRKVFHYLLHNLLEVPRNIHDHDPLISLQQQEQLQQLHPLSMQQVLPPMPHHQLR